MRFDQPGPTATRAWEARCVLPIEPRRNTNRAGFASADDSEQVSFRAVRGSLVCISAGYYPNLHNSHRRIGKCSLVAGLRED